MWINPKNILRFSSLSSSIIRNTSSFKSNLPDTAWTQRESYRWFMPMQTRFKVNLELIKAKCNVNTLNVIMGLEGCAIHWQFGNV